MGSSYFFEGSINIEPPLNFAEIKTAQRAALGLLTNTWDKKHSTEENVFVSHMPLKPELDSFVKDTDEGPLHVTRSAVMVPSNSSDGGQAYLMKELMEALIKALPGHNWSGTVMAMDDDRTGAVKIVVDTGIDTSTVSEIRGKVLVEWENGDLSTPAIDISG